MNKIVKPQHSVEKIERFQSLQAGQYWRALQPILTEGIVLLIKSILWADQIAHTIILRSHPSKLGTTERVQIQPPNETETVSEKSIYYQVA